MGKLGLAEEGICKENSGKGCRKRERERKERERKNIHGAFWEGKSFNVAESQNVKQTEGHGPRGDWKNRGGNRVH